MAGYHAYGTFERPMRICICTENFLPNIDGVTVSHSSSLLKIVLKFAGRVQRTLARLLTHLREEGHEAMILGPESGMCVQIQS